MHSAAVGFYEQLRLEHSVVVGVNEHLRPDVNYTWICPTVNCRSLEEKKE